MRLVTEPFSLAETPEPEQKAVLHEYPPVRDEVFDGSGLTKQGSYGFY